MQRSQQAKDDSFANLIGIGTRMADQTHSDTVMNENEGLTTHELIANRKQKLAELRQEGNAYPNHFHRDSLANKLHQEYGEKSHDELEQLSISVKVAGRMMLKRLMGKASFIHIQDMSGRIQTYLRKDDLPEGLYEQFLRWDLGDIVGIEGVLFKTKTGELSIKAKQLHLLTKSLRPLPDKFHGLSDQETRYRQRYLDLIVNEESRQVFKVRTKIINSIRGFLNAHDYLEVETPMMQVIPGGALAKPFITHHNALDMDLYLRISPELYLKRLVVGGFERVYEINRNFRNEGLSTRHNPEFTMIEFYQAYSDYNDLMDLTELMLQHVAKQVLGTTIFQFQNETIDFAKPFERLTVKEAILKYNPSITLAELDDLQKCRALAHRLELSFNESDGLGKLQIAIFEETVEQHLKQPTFITEYPTEVSPLARSSDKDPSVTDRFELYIGKNEIANGFSELNDSEDQAQRFLQQVKAKDAGDQEAMYYDADYITALEYGMPPTAGEGIGIDRLVMLLTDTHTIRDVLLFPHLRPTTESSGSVT